MGKTNQNKKEETEIPIIPYDLEGGFGMELHSVERLPPSIVKRLLEPNWRLENGSYGLIDLADEVAIQEALDYLHSERDQDAIIGEEEAYFWVVYELFWFQGEGGYPKVLDIGIGNFGVYVWFWTGEFSGDEAKHNEPSYAVYKKEKKSKRKVLLEAWQTFKARIKAKGKGDLLR